MNQKTFRLRACSDNVITVHEGKTVKKVIAILFTNVLKKVAEQFTWHFEIV